MAGRSRPANSTGRSSGRPLHAELDRLEGIYRANLEKAGVEIHDQRATLDDAHTVRLADGETFRAKHILIATGGRPFVPDTVPGHDLAWTSNDIFLMEELPERVLIVGGGYIACEFACILNGLGVEGHAILPRRADPARLSTTRRAAISPN